MIRPSKAPSATKPVPPVEPSLFGCLFGGCCTGPREEVGEKVEELDTGPKKKKEKKGKQEKRDHMENKSRENKDSCSVTTSAGTGPPIDAKATAASSSSAGAFKSERGSRRYRIDNSILKMENRPGVAFRWSKRVADKVRGEAGCAKWGDVVEALDGGDGWLKVGAYFLPTKHQGIPVVALLEEETEQDALPAATEAGTPGEQEPAEVVGGTSSELEATKSCAHQAAALLQLSSLEEESGAEEEELQQKSGAEEEGAPRVALKEWKVDTPQERVWYMRPSVGTWLQAQPQQRPAGPAAAVEAVQQEEQWDCAPRRQEAKTEPPMAINWALLPSVTTWYSRRLPAAARRSLERSAAAALAAEAQRPLARDDLEMPGGGTEFDQKQPHPKEV